MIENCQLCISEYQLNGVRDAVQWNINQNNIQSNTTSNNMICIAFFVLLIT